MIIDAHRHYWDPSRLEYGWLAHAPAALQCSFLPPDIGAIRDACILVQAAPDERETLFLFDLARQTEGVLGVVGWVEMEADDATQRIEELIERGQGAAVRHPPDGAGHSGYGVAGAPFARSRVRLPARSRPRL
ncbi:hypothetical protein [Dyella jiangningensis]